MDRARRCRASVAAGALLMLPSFAWAQANDAPPGDAQLGDAQPGDIVVTGKRPPGSVIADVAPVAVLDAAQLRSLGTNLDDILRQLKPLTTSASGADPVFLLNGRRVSGYQEIQSLPPEAIERTEVMPETEASRFGFPPTVRLVNFITKRHFRALGVEQGVSTTTDGGGSSATLSVNPTRLDRDRRFVATIDYIRQDPLPYARRPTFADPANLFDLIGNVTGIAGGSVSPALDALAGRPVTVAPVPLDPAQRGRLAGYVVGAGVPRPFDPAPYLSLQSSDQVKINATQGVPIGSTVTASLNLSMDAKGGARAGGLATALLRVPGANPYSPFGSDVLLYRYLPEGGLLRQSGSGLSLHAGSTVQGSLKRWLWTVTGTYDRALVRITLDQGIDPSAVQAAIDAGADPFRGFASEDVAKRLTRRSRTVTETLASKATATGPVLKLPAGDARMTVTADYTRASSSGSLAGSDGSARDLIRTVRSASANVDLPITSRDRGVLDAIGTLSANATLGVSSVSDYGSLLSRYLGLTWTPVVPVQITASLNVTQTAPDIAQLTSPVVTIPNVSFFDFATGTSPLVTFVTGGNADLAPERRSISTVGVTWKPIKARELRLALNYIETRIDDQTANIVRGSPALLAAFPERFGRDANGQLLTADLRPINIAFERERKLEGRVTLWTPIGAAPKLPATPPGKDAPPPKARPSLYSFVTTTLRLDDQVMLRPGQPLLDALSGDAVSSVQERPRFEAQGTIGGSVGALQGGIFGLWKAPTRIRSDIPSADLRFSARMFVSLYSTVDVAQLVPKVVWAKRTTVQFNVQNLFNNRVQVRDRNGVIPYAFQPSFQDWYGRIVKLSVRKLF